MDIVAHLDLDAFFAAVEELDRPYLSGLPVVIGADPAGGAGRGVVSTANYAARAYGIHSAQAVSQAWRLSEQARKEGKPRAAFLTPRISRYQELSRSVFSCVAAYTDSFERTSIDEGYLDLKNAKTFARAKEQAHELKNDIYRNTGLRCSIGIAANKTLAKIASDAEKPNGLTVIEPHEAKAFLAPFSIRTLPGIGPKTEDMLNKNGIRTVGDIQERTEESLHALVGTRANALLQKSCGIFSTPVASEAAPPKSIGEEETFAEDTNSMEHVLTTLEQQANSVISRMNTKRIAGFRSVTLIVRFSDFETKTRSLTSKILLTDAETLATRATKLALPFFEARENPDKKAIRLVGLRIEKLG